MADKKTTGWSFPDLRNQRSKDRDAVRKLDESPIAKFIEEDYGAKPSELFADPKSAIAGYQAAIDARKSGLSQAISEQKAPAEIAESTAKGKLSGIQNSLIDRATQENTDEVTKVPAYMDKALIPDSKGGYQAVPYSDFTQPAPEPQKAVLSEKGETSFTPSETELQVGARKEMLNTEARKMAEVNTARLGFNRSLKDYGMFVSQINLPNGSGLEWIPNKIRLEKEGLTNTAEGAAYNSVKGLNRNLAPTIRRLSMDVGNATGWEQMGAMMMLINGSENVYVRDLKMAYLQNLGKALDSNDPNAVKSVIQSWIKSPEFQKLHGDWSSPETQEKQNIESVTLDLIDQGKPFKDVMSWKIKKMAEVERKYGGRKRSTR